MPSGAQETEERETCGECEEYTDDCICGSDPPCKEVEVMTDQPKPVDLDELAARATSAINGARTFRNHIPSVVVPALTLERLIAEVRACRAAKDAARRIEHLHHHPMGDAHMVNAIAGLLLALGLENGPVPVEPSPAVGIEDEIHGPH